MHGVLIFDKRLVLLLHDCVSLAMHLCRQRRATIVRRSSDSQTSSQPSRAVRGSAKASTRSVPVLLDVERPLKLQVCLVIVVDEFRDSFVVSSADHTGWCGLTLDCASISRVSVASSTSTRVTRTLLLILRLIRGVWRIRALRRFSTNSSSRGRQDVPAFPASCSSRPSD